MEIYKGGNRFYVVTIIAKYIYEKISSGGLRLCSIMTACIPNGKLQDRYNPSAQDGIWLAGRNAPTLGEDFRVRLSFEKLENKASWRVNRIHIGDG